MTQEISPPNSTKNPPSASNLSPKLVASRYLQSANQSQDTDTTTTTRPGQPEANSAVSEDGASTPTNPKMWDRGRPEEQDWQYPEGGQRDPFRSYYKRKMAEKAVPGQSSALEQQDWQIPERLLRQRQTSDRELKSSPEDFPLESGWYEGKRDVADFPALGQRYAPPKWLEDIQKRRQEHAERRAKTDPKVQEILEMARGMRLGLTPGMQAATDLDDLGCLQLQPEQNPERQHMAGGAQGAPNARETPGAIRPDDEPARQNREMPQPARGPSQERMTRSEPYIEDEEAQPHCEEIEPSSGASQKRTTQFGVSPEASEDRKEEEESC
ncbi:uncharacterized protein J3D65DRAFT_667955 [Phyllosticta citribraziliensis]|uniref:Uncharacterized protein n=1 Tax=Phyllosticta citribraziliensis TaxID=989973 RepID=A0ABR1LQ21_9PEZI